MEVREPMMVVASPSAESSSGSAPEVFALATLMTVGALWALSIYVIGIIRFADRPTHELSWFEKRFVSPVSSAKWRWAQPWMRFRQRFDPAVDAVRRAQWWQMLPSRILACALGGVFIYCAARFCFSGPIDASIGFLPFVLLVTSSVFPLAVTQRIATWLWRTRARAEWRVVFAARSFEAAVAGDVKQDAVVASSADVMAVLADRFQSPGERDESARMRWRSRIGRVVEMRAAVVVADLGNRRRWERWARRWLDEIARSFEPGTANDLSSAPDKAGVLVASDARGKSLRILTWVLFAAGVCGAVLLLVVEQGIDWRLAQTVWKSASGTAITLGSVVTSIVAIGGALGFIRRQ